MKLAHILLVLVGITLVAMYVVSTQVTRERFEDGAKADNGKSGATTDSKYVAPGGSTAVDVTFPVIGSGAAKAGLVDAQEAERVDAMVFKAYIDVFGVPPTPPTSKHYASLVITEALNESGLKTRVEEDAQNALQMSASTEEGAAVKGTAAGGATVGRTAPPAPEMDASMRALRESSAATASMSEPIAPVTQDGMGQLGSKLRSIATQVSSLARQYDIPGLGKAKDDVKGVESFINLCR
jgi:hypothetical protein